MTIQVATSNAHKLEEIQAMLKVPVEGIGLDVNENGRTFEANAVKKARAAYKHLPMMTLADDSGLMVDCLNGRPGIKSARFASPSTPENLCIKLLKVMKNCRRRGAQFVCAMALIYPNGKVKTVKGVVRGRIINEMRGANGFGYDAVFMPAGFKKTFAEMSSAQKNKLSHRSRALKKIKAILAKQSCR